MKQLSVNELKTGMVFTKPVYFEGDNLLVSEGLPLKEKDIERLKRWDITIVKTEGELFAPSSDKTAGAADFQKDIVLLSLQKETEQSKLYDSILTRVVKQFAAIRDNKDVDVYIIDQSVNELFQAVQQSTSEFISLILKEDAKKQQRLAGSSINTTILSIVLAINLKLPSHKILNLSTAALLHDTGMLRIPEAILSKKGDLTKDELNQIHMHTIYSYNIITKELRYPEEVGQIAIQHHERWDGQGYPKKMKQEEILLPARILSVADSYEAMISERPYRNQIIGYNALKNILSDNSRRFDPRVLKTFIKSMGIYPIGSIVILNDSRIGRVIRTNTDAPLRPDVELVLDSKGNPYPPQEKQVVSLMEEKSLFIARAIDPKDIRKA